MTNISSIPMKIKNCRNLLTCLSRLLYQKQVELGAISEIIFKSEQVSYFLQLPPCCYEKIVKWKVEYGWGWNKHPGVGRLLWVVQQLVSSFVQNT